MANPQCRVISKHHKVARFQSAPWGTPCASFAAILMLIIPAGIGSLFLGTTYCRNSEEGCITESTDELKGQCDDGTTRHNDLGGHCLHGNDRGSIFRGEVSWLRCTSRSFRLTTPVRAANGSQWSAKQKDSWAGRPQRSFILHAFQRVTRPFHSPETPETGGEAVSSFFVFSCVLIYREILLRGK